MQNTQAEPRARLLRELNQSGAFQGRVSAILVDRFHGAGGQLHRDVTPQFGDIDPFGAQIGSEATGGVGRNVCPDTPGLFRLTAPNNFPA